MSILITVIIYSYYCCFYYYYMNAEYVPDNKPSTLYRLFNITQRNSYLIVFQFWNEGTKAYRVDMLCKVNSTKQQHGYSPAVKTRKSPLLRPFSPSVGFSSCCSGTLGVPAPCSCARHLGEPSVLPPKGAMIISPSSFTVSKLKTHHKFQACFLPFWYYPYWYIFYANIIYFLH